MRHFFVFAKKCLIRFIQLIRAEARCVDYHTPRPRPRPSPGSLNAGEMICVNYKTACVHVFIIMTSQLLIIQRPEHEGRGLRYYSPGRRPGTRTRDFGVAAPAGTLPPHTRFTTSPEYTVEV